MVEGTTPISIVIAVSAFFITQLIINYKLKDLHEARFSQSGGFQIVKGASLWK